MIRRVTPSGGGVLPRRSRCLQDLGSRGAGVGRRDRAIQARAPRRGRRTTKDREFVGVGNTLSFGRCKFPVRPRAVGKMVAIGSEVRRTAFLARIRRVRAARIARGRSASDVTAVRLTLVLDISVRNFLWTLYIHVTYVLGRQSRKLILQRRHSMRMEWWARPGTSARGIVRRLMPHRTFGDNMREPTVVTDSAYMSVRTQT